MGKCWDRSPAMTYAANTEVSPGRSRDEIERTLTRYDATQFAYGWDGERAVISFVMQERQVRFVLPLPDRASRRFTQTTTGRARSKAAQITEYEQAVKQRWRALALVVKAKLEAVETGIVTFDQEFGMHMVLPNGSVVADVVMPGVNKAYLTGVMPQLLALGS